MTYKREACIIDDNEIDCLVAKVIIESFQVLEVKAFTSVDSALTHLARFTEEDNKRSSPALILLDLEMPLKNGWDFLEAYTLLTKQIEGDLPSVYILTASLHQADHNRALENPLINGVLVKPLNFTDIETILSGLPPGSAFEAST